MFCLFLSVSLCFSLAFFGLRLFQFLFLCLSLVLFFLLFLLVFLFCFILVPCFCLFLSFSFFFAFVSCKEQHQNTQLQSIFFINPFSFSVSCLVFSFRSVLLIFIFLAIQLCFCSTSLYWVSKQTSLKTQISGQEGGLQQNFFVVRNLCVAKCEKLLFWGPF